MIPTRYIGDRLLASFGLLVMLLALAALSVLIYDVLHDGITRISWAFLTSEPSRRAEAASWVARPWASHQDRKRRWIRSCRAMPRSPRARLWEPGRLSAWRSRTLRTTISRFPARRWRDWAFPPSST